MISKRGDTCESVKGAGRGFATSTAREALALIMADRFVRDIAKPDRGMNAKPKTKTAKSPPKSKSVKKSARVSD